MELKKSGKKYVIILIFIILLGGSFLFFYNKYGEKKMVTKKETTEQSIDTSREGKNEISDKSKDKIKEKEKEKDIEKGKEKEKKTTEDVREEALPEDYDLPLEEVSNFHPDPLHISDLKYEEMPVLKSSDEVGLYIIYSILKEKYTMEFYLDRSLNVTDEVGFQILESGVLKARTYLLLDAYGISDEYTEDRGDEEGVYAKLTFEYSQPEYDLEAKAEALEYVLKNPVPKDGFSSAEEEKEYAHKIHDFVAKKVTYDPIGYDQEQMNILFGYEAKQEAYNVLGEKESTAVCSGYARAFALIAQYAGIDCVWVMGNEIDGGGSHAWNIIYPCDGSGPYTVDVTWDDTNSYDVIGQTEVDTFYFYKPVDEDYEHCVNGEMMDFLDYMRIIKKKLK